MSFMIVGMSQDGIACSSYIFNKEPKQWGAYKYEEAKDALRVDVKTKPLKATQERLVYKITKTGFSLDWDKISVPVSIK